MSWYISFFRILFLDLPPLDSRHLAIHVQAEANQPCKLQDRNRSNSQKNGFSSPVKGLLILIKCMETNSCESWLHATLPSLAANKCIETLRCIRRACRARSVQKRLLSDNFPFPYNISSTSDFKHFFQFLKIVGTSVSLCAAESPRKSTFAAMAIDHKLLSIYSLVPSSLRPCRPHTCS